MTRCWPVLLAALLLAAAAPAAAAKELPASVRAMAERAFLEGRLHDLDDILAGAEEAVDRFPLLLRTYWWRRASGALPALPEGAAPLTVARAAWIRSGGSGPYPVADGGGEPYPVLTALVQDRIWREQLGPAGLPEDGPLEALSRELDPVGRKLEIWHLGERTRYLMTDAYGGPQPYPELEEHERQAASLRARNGALAVGAVALFVLLPLLCGLYWFRRRED